jgi:hypothetical protein
VSFVLHVTGLDLEEEGSKLLQNVGDYLPIDTPLSSNRPVFYQLAVRTSDLPL